MKKLFVLFAFTGFLIACNDNATGDGSASGDTATKTPAPAPDAGNTSAGTTTLKDSLMQFKDGKVMIVTAGSWSALSATVTTTNGRVVNPNGEISKGGKTRKMEEGMMIDKDGQMMDKDGKIMDNTGWE